MGYVLYSNVWIPYLCLLSYFVFFKVNKIFKYLTLKILFFIFHRPSLYILEKKKKNGGHHANYLSG